MVAKKKERKVVFSEVAGPWSGTLMWKYGREQLKGERKWWLLMWGGLALIRVVAN